MANAFRPPSDLRGDGPIRGPLERHIRALQKEIRRISGAGYRPGEKIYYTLDGTFKKADYPGLRAVLVQVIGAGGGGGSAPGGGGQASGGSGGGGGFSEKTIPVDDLGTSETVTRGDKGDGGSADSDDASSGGSSSFGSHCSATGGGRGREGTNTSGAGAGLGGGGGSGSGGDLNLDGTDGGRGRTIDGRNVGQNFSGASIFGGGVAATTGGQDATDAAAPGAGGGGALAVSVSRAGGDGANGLVIVTPLY